MIGLKLRMKLAELARVHRVRPIERAPLPLLAATGGPQILEGYCTTPDLDADRMVVTRGSLSWPTDLKTLPLLVSSRSQQARRPGTQSALRQRRSPLHQGARDDSEARRLQDFRFQSSSVRAPSTMRKVRFLYATIENGLIAEISSDVFTAKERCVRCFIPTRCCFD